MNKARRSYYYLRVVLSQPRYFVRLVHQYSKTYNENQKLRRSRSLSGRQYVRLENQRGQPHFGIPIGGDKNALLEETGTKSATYETYKKIPNSRWRSDNVKNATLGIIYSDEFPKGKIAYPEMSKMVGYPLTAGQGSNFEDNIDVVITWVNATDESWKKRFSHYSLEEDKDPEDEAIGLDRFIPSNRLKYVLRSLSQNFRNLGNIYILSNCEAPKWLNLNHAGISWVHHEQVIDNVFLPTFNSHVIESYIHHIDGLSENFLYFNDDVFLTKPCGADMFFSSDNKSYAFLDSFGSVSGYRSDNDPYYLNASRHSAELLLEKFGHYPCQLHKHSAFALKRSELFALEENFSKPIKLMRNNRFRSHETDLNIPSFLYQHYSLLKNKAVSKDIGVVYIANNDLRWLSKLVGLRGSNPDLVCLNRAGNLRTSKLWDKKVGEFLGDIFPNASPWEK